MQESPTVAVVGARTAVGQTALQLISVREDRWGEVRAADVAERAGGTVTCRGEELEVKELSDAVFDGVDIALFCADADVADAWALRAVEHGAVVIDDSSRFRLEPDVPLVLPEVNPAQVRQRPRGIIANPSCTTLILLDVVAPLNSTWGLRELVVTTFQAASGIGDEGVRRLHAEMDVLAGDPRAGRTINSVRAVVEDELPEPSPFQAPLAMNVVPWIGDREEGGWSSMERSVQAECRKILAWGDLHMAATCVRVPVAIGHSISVHATFQDEVTPEAVRRTLIEAPSVVVLDDPDHNEWPTPIDAVGCDPTFVGRIRSEAGHTHCVNLFLCGDNIRKGAALNLLEIAELLHDEESGRRVRLDDADPESDEES